MEGDTCIAYFVVLVFIIAAISYKLEDDRHREFVKKWDEWYAKQSSSKKILIRKNPAAYHMPREYYDPNFGKEEEEEDLY
jgi:hypothetical protein